MSYIPSFNQFLNEGTLNEDFRFPVPITHQITVKTGEKIWRLMRRYNPQLGQYYSFSQVTVNRVSPKSISCDDNAVYDKTFGNRLRPKDSGYGYAEYQIMTHEDAKIAHSNLVRTGARISGTAVE